MEDAHSHCVLIEAKPVNYLKVGATLGMGTKPAIYSPNISANCGLIVQFNAARPVTSSVAYGHLDAVSYIYMVRDALEVIGAQQ